MTTRTEVENYLANYPKTRSTEMDDMFDMFKSDVSSIARDVEKNEAYIYTKDEYIEFLEEQLADVEDEDDKERLIDEINENKERNFDVVIDTAGSTNQYYV